MQIELSAMWDQLRELGYKSSFLMIQSSGGIGEVFRTTASRTFNGGPVSGLMGAHHVATSLGYKNVVDDRHGRHQLRRRPGRRKTASAATISARSSTAGWSASP